MNWLLLQELAAGTLLAGVMQWLATHAAFLPVRRLSQDTHWTERSRKAWSVRLLIGMGPAILLGVVLGASAILPTIKARGETDTLRLVLVPICVALGAMIGGIPIARRLLGRNIGLADFLREYAVSFLVISPATTILLLMFLLLIPRGLEPASVGIMIGGLVSAAALTLGLAIPIVRVLGLLAPAPQRLLEVVTSASEQARISPPPVYLLRWHQANAFAFPFARLLAFTESALEVLNDRELRAVCRHEIAHLQESTSSKLTRLSGIIVIFPLFTIPVWSKAFGALGALVPVGIYLLGNRFLQCFGQRMEQAADNAAHAGEKEGETACYAQALEKIYRFNSVPAVMRGNGHVHPHLYDRMMAAGLPPDYPRPKAPSILPFIATVFLLVFGTVLPVKLLTTQIQEPDLPYSFEEAQATLTGEE